jgi:transposase
LVLYPINPQSLAKYRKAFFSSGAKDDPGDAALLEEMVRLHPDRLRAWVPDDALTRSLQLLVEERRHWVDQRTALTNQLTSTLKHYFPQALEWAGALDTRQACAFLKRWPTLEKLQKAKPAHLRKFYLEHGCRRLERIEQRLAQIAAGQPLTEDPAILVSSRLTVETLIRQIPAVNQAIEQFDQQITRLFEQHPDHLLFESFPGAGPVLAPRLLAAFGADRQRFQGAREVQQLSGIAPVTERSGNSCWVHWRLACPKFLRQTFYEFAGQSIVRCDWARAYYQQQRARGQKHPAAVRALAYKWIRILFRCWQQRVAYDNAVYRAALQRRQSPLVLALTAPQLKKAASG